MDDFERPDARPATGETRSGALEPFIEATVSVLAEMAQAAAGPRAVDAIVAPRRPGDVSVVLDLTPTPGARLVLDFPGPTAAALAARVLAEAGAAADEALIGDCMGEIANVIAGQAKALLHGTAHRFAFSTPRIIPGGDPAPGPDAGREFLVVAFASDAGDFTLRLCPAGGG